MKIIDSAKYLVNPHYLEDVFTPTSIAHLTYVKRDYLEKEFKKFLLLPGMQIAIYGNSGSGKTTLVNNVLQKLFIKRVKTSCTENSTYDQLIVEAFDRIGIYYVSEKSEKEKNIIGKNMSAKYLEISANIKAQSEKEKIIKENRLVAVQLTAQRLAEFLGEAGYVWIIEDFHKVNEKEKKKLSQVLKVFMDCSDEYPMVKIICIGAVGTARELIQYDKELSNRVAEIYVPLMSSSELEAIIKKGFKLLNISCETGYLIDKIIYYSNRLASVCHQLCYDICNNSAIKKSSITKKNLNEENFSGAVKSYLNKVSDTFTKYYEKACSIEGCKRLMQDIIDKDEEMYDINTNEQDTGNPDTIVKEKKKILDKLLTPEYGEIFRVNQYSRKYYFSSPLFQTFLRMKFAQEKSDKEKHQERNKYDLNMKKLDELIFMKYLKIMDNSIDWENIKNLNDNNNTVIDDENK